LFPTDDDSPQNRTGAMTEPTPAMTRKERELASHSRDILDTAIALFAENGYHQTTMQMIAERAEFSVGYLYKHFSGKEEMYRKSVTYHFQHLDAIIDASEASSLSPLDKIMDSYRQICSHFNHHRDFMRIYHEEIGERVVDMQAIKCRHHKNLVLSLRNALDQGQLRPHDPVMLAAAIQGATKEMFKIFAERPGDTPFDLLPDTLFSLLIDPLRA